MFSLIITIISIALVAALALATLYYGGDAYNQGRSDAEAGKVLNQLQQLQGAAEIFYVKQGRWPNDIPELVAEGYLKSVPVALVPESAVGTALANGTEWTMPVAQQPVFLLTNVDSSTCQRVNKRSFDIDGILPRAHTSLAAQCYGEGPTAFKVVAAKGSARLAAAAAANTTALPSAEVTSDALPDTSDTAAWTTPPSAVVGGSGPSAPEAGTPAQVVASIGGDGTFYGYSGMMFTRPVTLTNTGGTVASFTGAPTVSTDMANRGNPAPVAIASNSCGSSLAPGASCTLGVAFEPSTPPSGTMTITHAVSNPESASSWDVPVVVASFVEGTSYALPEGLASSPYSVNLRDYLAVHFAADVTAASATLDIPSLPANLTFNPVTGVLSGTPSVYAGSFVVNVSGAYGAAPVSFYLVVNSY